MVLWAGKGRLSCQTSLVLGSLRELQRAPHVLRASRFSSLAKGKVCCPSFHRGSREASFVGVPLQAPPPLPPKGTLVCAIGSYSFNVLTLEREAL